jgi:exonuclease VII small subunit
MRGPGGFQHDAPDPVLLDGPPVPADFAVIASPDTAQAARYQSLYDNLMASTHDDRDSLRTTRTEMRAARGSQDHESMRQSMAATQQLVAALQSSQQAFDDALKAMLSGEQFKRYEAWRQQRRKQAEEQMKRRMQDRSGEPAAP